MSASYHRGELAVQARAGLSAPAGNSLRAIRATMPAVAAAFLTQQPVIVVSATDVDGVLWTTMITGAPGFLQPRGEQAMTIGARPAPPDPLAEALAGPAEIGMIAIEPATRRRMRINGRSRPEGDGLHVEFAQVVANCPKYIQRRSPSPAVHGAPRVAYRGEVLTDAQRRLIGAADTFFVGTAAEGGADASHRGGNPGFVRVVDERRLCWPDYVGNAMFLTLGNLEVDPVASLLFVDWASGTTLHLSGVASVDFSPERAATIPGAERVVDFTVAHVVEIAGGSALEWDAPEFSKFNPPVSA